MRNRPAHALVPACLRAAVRSLFNERRCLACSAVFRPEAGQPASPAALFCPACAALLQRRDKGYCPLCGECAAWPGLPLAPCGRCLTAPPPWQGFVFHAPHQGRLRELLIRLKFQEQVLLGHALGGLLAAHPRLASLRADAVTPVPLHPRRLTTRGYNQALELARPLARALGLPLLPGLLARTRHTPPQTGKAREERVRNLQDAFTAPKGVEGRRLLLVDDTLTTGATLASAARSLLRAGAAEVSVAVVSRTALRHGAFRT